MGRLTEVGGEGRGTEKGEGTEKGAILGEGGREGEAGRSARRRSDRPAAPKWGWLEGRHQSVEA